MKLATFETSGITRSGVVLGDWIADLALADRFVAGQLGEPAHFPGEASLGLKDVLARGQRGLDACRQVVTALERSIPDCVDDLQQGGVVHRLWDVRLLPPVPDPQKIIGVGLNYGNHAAEAGLDPQACPELFAVFPNTLIGHRSAIVLPRISQAVDYEAELAVVILKRGRYISVDDAAAHIAGYSIMNDVSARDISPSPTLTQWLPAKGIDTFAPMGPWLVTADEVGDPQTLHMTLRVNGELLQDANTAEMIYSVHRAVSYISEVMTLVPGDVITTGTPAGVGCLQDPPRFLAPGDRIEIAIDRVGTLVNVVEAEPDAGL